MMHVNDVLEQEGRGIITHYGKFGTGHPCRPHNLQFFLDLMAQARDNLEAAEQVFNNQSIPYECRDHLA